MYSPPVIENAMIVGLVGSYGKIVIVSEQYKILFKLIFSSIGF